MSGHNGETIVEIKDIHLHPEEQYGALVGRSLDETTTYVLRLNRDEFSDLIETVRIAPDDSLVMPQEICQDRCPRCDFVEAMSMVAYAGGFIREHFEADAPGQLNAEELAVLKLCEAWSANDAIERCRESEDDDCH